MSLFSDHVRTRLGPPDEGEPVFEYLDASARSEAAQARDDIEDWLAIYPVDKIDRWIGDFKSRHKDQHRSAFFELFLFSFFKSTGWEVEVETEFEGLSGRPDFLLRRDTGETIVVEAVSPSAGSDSDRGRTKLLNELKDALNTIKISDYFLGLQFVEAPDYSIKKQKLLRCVNEWLATRPEQGSVLTYSDGGALIQIEAIRCSPRDTEDPDYRAIGIEHTGTSVSTPGERVRKSLLTKASKYRSLDLPYVVALNSTSMLDSEEDFIAATYGTPAVRFRMGCDGLAGEPQWVRNEDGLFNEGGRPRKTNVSATLIFDHVAPWQWRNRKSYLINNAYASHPIDPQTTIGDIAYIAADGVLERVERADWERR